MLSVRNRFGPLLGLVLALFSVGGFAQGQVAQRIAALSEKGTRFQPVELFTSVERSPATDALWDKALTEANVLALDEAAALNSIRTATAMIALQLPRTGGVFTLDLERVELFAEGFQVRVASTGNAVPYAGGIHYRGMIRGVPGSIAAISIFPDMVMGLIADAEGQWVVGPFEDAPSGYHVMYRDDRLRGDPGSTCTPPKEPQEGQPNAAVDSDDRTIRCVGYYWEVAYDIHQNKGGVVGATNYITGLFNQSALLFQNDGIDVNLTELFVWNVPSPYNANSSGGRLDQFGVERTTFNGNMAHLIDLGNYGGVAYLNSICNSQARFRMAYSGIDANYSNVPTYSWSVMVVTHEAGHNLGSQHTHACSWNGNNTAIDGCGQVAGYPEGSCAQGPLPISSVGGTIMSYCHLTSSTINLANGFGPQPAARIQDRVNGATCLPNCGSSCDPPGTLFVTGLTTTTATLNWLNVGASAYDVEWKAVAALEWILISGVVGTSSPLTGLTEGTAYQFRVRSVCGGSTSPYSASTSFSTPLPCPDALEPNNTLIAAADVGLPASTSALIAASNDVDYYRFTIAQSSAISIFMGNLPADYDLRLLSSTGSQLAISQNGGTSSEFINYAAVSGTYVVHVYGYQGANNAFQCYSLSINAVLNACEQPDGLSATEISWDEALVQWPAVQGASSYDLQWRVLGEQTWNELGALSTTSQLLTGLDWNTEYEARVRSRCQGIGGAQGGSTSDYTLPITFTTLVPPCEVFAPTTALVQLWLDGPYVQQAGLMLDSLRAKGLLPLNEPYTAMGYTVEGSTSMPAERLLVTGPTAIVDWVLVELRDPASPTVVVERRAALLQRNGIVVRPEGSGDLQMIQFCAAQGEYHLAVRHRNHLGCMTDEPWGLGPLPAPVFFRDPSFATWGTNARRVRNGVMLLWPGNANADDLVKYTGEVNDRDVILNAVGGVVSTSTISGYHSSDVNLDGVVKYTGADNDRDVILQAIGGVVPTTVRQEQMP
ncbi:MAG: fibronectin type III domain-containing protein [Flavobacteriales bacterium]